MKKALFISASLNPGAQSSSRVLGAYACDKLTSRFPSVTIIGRDLSENIPPPMTPQNITAIVNGDSSTPESAAHLKESDELSDELDSSDLIIIATPLYNLFVPAGLKAYIDLLIRKGKNFEDSPTGPKGLLNDRPLLVLLTCGGPLLESDKDYLTSYFKRTFGFIGVHNVSLIAAEKLNMGDELANKSIQAVKNEINNYFSSIN